MTVAIAETEPSEAHDAFADIRQLTVAEACEITKYSRSFLYELMDAGKLEYVRCGRSRRIPVGVLREFLNSRRIG